MVSRMKALSTDLRERVLAAHARGLTRKEIIELFGVSQGSITRWVRQHKTTGSVAPRRPPGRAPLIPPTLDDALRRQLAAFPDATLAEHVAHWAANHDVLVSPMTIARAFRRVGWSRKKSR